MTQEIPQTLRVSLGCGMKKPSGFIGIDISPYKCVDYVLDIGREKLPFDDNSVYEIHSDNVYEHLGSSELFFSIEECFRILQPHGFLFVKVPKWGTQAWLLHPEHKMHWTEDLFGFFAVPDNEGTVDPHGYLKGFWWLKFQRDDPERPEEAIWCEMYPNKPGSPFGYREVTRHEDE